MAKDKNPDQDPDKDSESEKSGRYKADNSGGFCNPPIRGQFQPGNKKGGRKPKAVTLESEISKLLRRKMRIKVDGEPVSMMPREILAKRIVSAILSDKATPKMIDYARKLFEELGPKEVETLRTLMDISDMSPIELKVFLALMERVMKAHPTPDAISSMGTQFNRYLSGTYKLTRRDDGHIVMERLTPDNEKE